MTLLICCHSAFRSSCLHSLWHFLYVNHLLVFWAFLKSLALRLSACLTSRAIQGTECLDVFSFVGMLAFMAFIRSFLRYPIGAELMNHFCKGELSQLTVQ